MAKMSKTNKRTDANVRKALTKFCDNNKDEIEGFDWVTHTADYSSFPGSLMVTVIFETKEQQEKCQTLSLLQKELIKCLFPFGIKLKDVRQNIRFDNEEQCKLQHDGNWAERLSFFSSQGYLKYQPSQNK